MSSRQQNERKFGQWQDLPNGGRRYWFEVIGRQVWKARYIKEVDSHEKTTRFWQEIFDSTGQLVEIHEKYPVEQRTSKDAITMTITSKTVADKIGAYLHHRISLAKLVDWAENAMMNAGFETRNADRIRDVVARLGVADVRAFGLPWEDCEKFLQSLGYSARIEIVAGRSAHSATIVREKPTKKYGK